MENVEITPEKNKASTADNVVSFEAMIQRAYENPNIDAAKLSKIYEMHERELGRKAETEFHKAFADAQAAIEPIVRTHEAHMGNNNKVKYKYVKLEDVIEIVSPIMAENGFVLSFNTADSHLPNHYRVTCALTHTKGHSELYKADIPIDSKGSGGTTTKTDVQAFGSTMSYGRRYLLCLIWNIATPDDNDGNRDQQPCQTQQDPNRPVSERQAMVLKDIAAKGDVDVKAFCKHHNINSLDATPAIHFNQARDALQSWGKKSVPLPEGVH